jgi:hypothetical protein
LIEVHFARHNVGLNLQQGTPRVVEPQVDARKISCCAMMVRQDSEKYARLVKGLNVKMA